MHVHAAALTTVELTAILLEAVGGGHSLRRWAARPDAELLRIGGIGPTKAARLLVEAGRLFDLPLYDHVIVAGDHFVSFARAGLL